MTHKMPRAMFDAAFWVGADGAHPEPGTVVTADDVRAGTYRPADPTTDATVMLRFLSVTPAEVWPKVTDTR